MNQPCPMKPNCVTYQNLIAINQENIVLKNRIRRLEDQLEKVKQDEPKPYIPTDQMMVQENK